jgi:PAS domain S-box-containing protein
MEIMGTGGTILNNIVRGKNSFNFSHHDHLSLFYSSKQDQLPAVSEFVVTGLENGGKCLYLFGENGHDHVIEQLESRAVSVESALDHKDLVFFDTNESYLRRDKFEPEFMIEMLKRTINQAISEGYSGLWVTGEMSWASDGYPGSEKLMEYEAKLNLIIPENRIAALCQYDISAFPSEQIMQAVQTHPGVIYGNLRRENKNYLPPRDFFEINNNSHGIMRMLNDMMGDKNRTNIAKGKSVPMELRRLLLKRGSTEWRNELRVFKESESYFRNLVNSAPVALIMTDTGGRCLFANESWYLLSGLSLQRSIGTGWQNAIHPDDVAVMGPWWYRDEKKQSDPGTECRILTTEGQIKWVDLKATPWYDDNGAWIGIIAAFCELDHRKKSSYGIGVKSQASHP